MQTEQNPIITPEAFALWVQRVATVNEQFAEALHNAADAVAVYDHSAASTLYQAVDVTRNTVHALRASKPEVAAPRKEKATTKPAVALGRFCGLFSTFILDLI